RGRRRFRGRRWCRRWRRLRCRRRGVHDRQRWRHRVTSGGTTAGAGVPYPGGPALRRMVADPGRFAAEHWGRAALLTRSADLPAGFADLLSLDGADELLSSRGLRTPVLPGGE